MIKSTYKYIRIFLYICTYIHVFMYIGVQNANREAVMG